MRLIASTVIAAAIAAGAIAPAFAEPQRYERHDDRRGPDERYDRGEREAYRDGRSDGRRDDRRWDRRDDRRDYYRDNYRWHRGDRLDTRHTRYVVVHERDYRHYGLRHPGRGEYYARTNDGDILLVAAATGLVLWALTN